MKKILYSLALGLLFHLTLSADLSTNDLHKYFMANYYQFGGQMKQSYELYKDLLGTTPAANVPTQTAPLYAYRGYIHLLYDTGNYAHVVQLIPLIDSLIAAQKQPATKNEDKTAFKDIQDIQLIFAQSLEKVGQHAKAADRFIKINDQFKSNPEIAFSTINSYLQRQEPKNALQVIDNFLNSSPRKANNFIFFFMKAQIQMQLGDKKAALDSVQKTLDMHPRFDKGWLLFALLQEQAGQLKDAIKGYTTFLEVSPSANREVEQHLLQLIFKQKIQEKNMNNSFNINKPCFDKALMLFDQKQYEAALKQIDDCLAEKPSEDESKLLKIQILTAMNKTETAAQTIKDWIMQNPTSTMWYRTLHLLTKAGLKIESAIAVLHDIEKKHPQNILPALYLADLYTRIPNPHKALIQHKKALALTKEKHLQEKILLQMAFIYYDEHNNNGLRDVITHVNNLQSTYAPLLNLIAYHYATHTADLDTAQTLITQVLKQEQGNPHYLDTQAMIYMQKNELDKALNILEKIAKSTPSDYTILLHLANAQYAKGKVQIALDTLTQASRYAQATHDKHECQKLLTKWQQKKAQPNIIAFAL